MPNLPEREKPLNPLEPVTVVEAGKISETSAEKEGLVQRVETPMIEKPVTSQGGIVVSPPVSTTPKIILPVSQSVFTDPTNWKKPITFAITWLLHWVERIRKIYPGSTIFKM